MGLKYLEGKSWSDISREERFFCAHLFFLIRSIGEKEFIQFLDSKTNFQIDENSNWEVAYEACFYRDLWHHRGKAGKLFSRKRTFDLCLLSDETIIVIEAKSNQEFEQEQLSSFSKDISQIRKETDVENVLLFGLVSSKYEIPKKVERYFSGPLINWKELANHYNGDPILYRADDVYENTASTTYGKNNLNGYMTGVELINSHQNNEDFMVGRKGGLRGELLTHDISSGKWKTRKYETNRESFNLNENWFRLSEFIKLIGLPEAEKE